MENGKINRIYEKRISKKKNRAKISPHSEKFSTANFSEDVGD